MRNFKFEQISDFVLVSLLQCWSCCRLLARYVNICWKWTTKALESNKGTVESKQQKYVVLVFLLLSLKRYLLNGVFFKLWSDFKCNPDFDFEQVNVSWEEGFTETVEIYFCEKDYFQENEWQPNYPRKKVL